MEAQTLEGGFATPAVDAAHAFRAIMGAMARPGLINSIQGAAPPAPVSVAAGTVLLTLCDPDTPVHLAGAHDCEAVRTWIAFHTGAPFASADRAMFAVGTWGALGDLNAYPIGTSEYPDRSSTLIVEMDAIASDGATLRGPGIKETATLSLPEIDAFQFNQALFPLGLDFIFTSGTDIAALPRTTEVQPCM
ncbi:MAG: phosphonate C-P lyase system protein PhnH [Pseudomonadota bacterium]